MKCWLFLSLAILGAWSFSVGSAEPIRPKVIVVATFEVGADTGDVPGEFQFWVEREKLVGSLLVPGVDRPMRYNAAGVYGVVSGTTSRAGQQLMALGLDQRFDLSRSYWLVNGIAGVNPAVASEGSAAWARHVIDGDIAYEIDAREAPHDAVVLSACVPATMLFVRCREGLSHHPREYVATSDLAVALRVVDDFLMNQAHVSAS